MLVRSRMTADVITASPTTTLAEALTLTRTHRIRHLPVLEKDGLVGLVTDRDLRLAMPPIWAEQRDELRAALHQKQVGEVMIRSIITTAPTTPIEDAARLMYGHRIGCLPVLDASALVGILTETDVMRAFVELFGHGEPSSRLEIRMQNRPGELARVVRLIGIDHKINITGMVVPPLSGTSDAVAIVHIQTLDPRPIINQLRQLGYQIGWPALDLDQAPVATATGERRRYWAEVL
ncbi:MAG: CBS and ACT domain-containing protein [Longimicrobiales bacterium]